ncbi:MAG: VCBS repeat-containing protein, partial [Candidatus Marinimicrobia bacterium]|nr:VCBS repeat-containing protein [Candidatus Neomarinimicrobiota bacterium]
MRIKYLLLYLLPIFLLKGQVFTELDQPPVTDDLGNSTSGVWTDYNNDGLLDLFVTNNHSEQNMLFIQNELGTFEPEYWDVFGLENKWSEGSTWADYNNDGFLDLLVINRNDENNDLYINVDGMDLVHSETIIEFDSSYSASGAWADYDNDGHLDLFIANAHNQNNVLYKNNGDGSFFRILNDTVVTDGGYSLGSIWGDINGDGYPDLFVANAEYQKNFLYMNNTDGSFTKIDSGAVVSGFHYSVGGSFGDYDNDGDLDLFVSNYCNENNQLYTNNGDGTFIEVIMGDIVTYGSCSEGSAWADYNNDGLLDLLVVNRGQQENLLFRNLGDGVFEKVLTETAVMSGRESMGCSFGDFDRDGDLDIYVSNMAGSANRLLKNNMKCSNWLDIELVGTASNRSSIGAKVHIKAEINGIGRWQMREISSQNGFRSNNALSAHFGLGDANLVDSLKVAWPSGVMLYFTALSPNRFITITEDSLITIDSTVTVDSLIPEPAITSIHDVPNDQGRWVHVKWWSSDHDFCGADITQYGIWEQGPEGLWVSLGNAPATQQREYTYLARTYGDSTAAGIVMSVFQITAHTNDPALYYSSEIDSGYSIDNLAPVTPGGLIATADSTSITLDWNEPIDEDFAYFAVYSDLAPDFNPTGREPLALVVESSYIDPGLTAGIRYHYRIAAVDANGNESSYSHVASAVAGPVVLSAPQTLTSAVDNNNVLLRWYANSEMAVAGYNIYGSTAPSPATLIDSTLSCMDTTISIGDLTYGTTYYFRITAFDTAGNESDFSNETSATIGALTAGLLSPIPGKYYLHPAYPNPFNPSTVIRYDLPSDA